MAALPIAAAEWEAQAAARARGVPYSPYLDLPVRWITERLDDHLWSKQRTIAETLITDRRVAVPSCFESGKSWLAARLACYWIDVHPPGEAFVVTTATTDVQVRAILWREINRAHARGKLDGRTTQREWTIGRELVAIGRKPADYDESAFQGIHARFVLVIIDEASGVPELLFRAAAGLTANRHSRQLAIGNPVVPDSYFSTICKPGSGWTVIPISAYDSPNFTGEPIPEHLSDLLISHDYERELRDEVGVDSAIYQARVLGQFATDNPEGVVPLTFVRRCQNIEREYRPDELLPIELGVDVGAGGDQTVIRERRGPVAGGTWRARTPDAREAVDLILEVIVSTGAVRVKVDVIGVGWAVVGWLRRLAEEGLHGAEIIAVNVGLPSTDPLRFPRLRDELWWEIGREHCRLKLWDLTGVDEVTVGQLIAPTWRPDVSGRHHIESKKETIARLKRSPDDADALLLAYYVPPIAFEDDGILVYEDPVAISPY